MEIFHVLTKHVQSRLLQNCRMWERVKQTPFDDLAAVSITGKGEIDPNK